VRKLGLASAVAITMLSVGGWSTVAFAGTTTQSQTQTQSIYSTHGQTASIDDSGTIKQCQNSSNSSVQTQTLSVTDNTNSNSQLSQSPQIINAITATTQAEQNNGDGGKTKQSQKLKDTLSTFKSSTNETKTSQTTTSTVSSQEQTNNGQKITVEQNSTSLTVGSNAESVQTQTVTNNGEAIAHSEKSSGGLATNDMSQTVVGYAVFDSSGIIVSNLVGNLSNAANGNIAQHYDIFTPNIPITVTIAAVNALGEILPSPSTISLYLKTTNSNGEFLNDQGKTFDAIILPQGSMGVTVHYILTSGSASFDDLNVSSVAPRPERDHNSDNVIYRQPPVEAVDQSQETTVGGLDAKESQKTVVKSDPSYSAGLPDQSDTLSQSSGASQSQTLNTSDNTKTVTQSENYNVQASQSTSSQSNSSADEAVSASQSESATGQDVKLEQSQGVTATNPNIDVTIHQGGSADANGASLDQSISVTSPSSTNTTGGTTITVHDKDSGTSQQYYAPTGGPVTITESESVDTSQSNNINKSVSISYDGDSIPVSSPTN
jgi:trimeric autotransporter adhesin